MALEKLGPYRIESLLGRGGMGTVYEGVEEATGQRVAVKVLSSGLIHDANFRDRFATEVETLKKLDHPHIVHMYGYGEQDGHLFYSMELVEGRNLQEELNSGRRFQWREVAALGAQVCGALRHAHDRGVIHRDLKPANLLLTPDDQVKLLDFGIAKLFGASSMTIAGGVIGTADYMSPEQATGRPVTTRSDLYSLGALLYCLLAGRPPFRGNSLPEVIHCLRFEEPPPIRKLVPEVPLEMEQILGQLLAKDPAQRIPTPHALAKRLKSMEFALSVDTSIHPPPPDVLNGSTAEAQRAETGEWGFEQQRTKAAGPSEAQAPPEANGPSEAVGPTEGGQSGPGGGEAPGDQQQQAPTALEFGGGASEPDPTLLSTSARPTIDLPADDEPEYRLAAEPGELPGSRSEPARGQPPARASASTNHFTTVAAERERRRRETSAPSDSDGPAWLKPLVTAAMLAIVVALVAGAWYATRPSSADEMYRRLAEAAEEGEPQRLVDVSGELERFLELYPDDERTADVRNWQTDLEAYRLQRRLEREARRVGGARYLEPVEQAYLRAMRAKRSDADEARRRLELLLKVFGRAAEGEADKTERECVSLARHELSRLRLPETRPPTDHGEELARRLAWARENLSEEELREFQRGIVELFAEEPWAAETVTLCRQALDRDGGAGE